MADFSHEIVKGQTHRLINSLFPPKGLFDTLADTPEELRVLFDLEMMANPRNQVSAGRLALVPDEGIVTGDTANQVMAAFVHCNDDGGRFNDGRLGAWYAALEIETAIEETVHHLTKRLALSEGGFPQQIQMRELIAAINVPLLNLCGTQASHPEFYDLKDYSKSQDFANSIRWPFVKDGEAGIHYDSIRKEGGINICVFKPDALVRPITQGDHYQYDWDAAGQITVARLTPVER